MCGFFVLCVCLQFVVRVGHSIVCVFVSCFDSECFGPIWFIRRYGNVNFDYVLLLLLSLLLL